MSSIVVDGAILKCPFGAAPCRLSVTSQIKCLADNKPVATLMDMNGIVNISGFGMCQSLANPQVAGATAAALGVLTPQPCMFNPAGPWMNVSTKVLADNKPCLSSDSRIICAMGMGMITVEFPGQEKVVL